MTPEVCYHKVCKHCNAEFTASKRQKLLCPICSDQPIIPKSKKKKEVIKPKITLKEIALKSNEEGLTYGQYLYQHGLYQDLVDNKVSVPEGLLTYNEIKALADAEGLSYREYMLRRQ